MSSETITTLVGVVSILLAFAGAFGWLIHRMDRQSTELRNDLGAQISSVRSDLGVRIDKVTDELVELKIAVARVEGPPRHLITGR